MNSLNEIVGADIVGAVLVVTMGHQVLFVIGSFRLRFSISVSSKLIILICLITVPRNAELVVSPEVFQSIKTVETWVKVRKPVAGNTKLYVGEVGLQENALSASSKRFKNPTYFE